MGKRKIKMPARIIINIVTILCAVLCASTPIHAEESTPPNDGIPYDVREYAEEIAAEYSLCPEIAESLIFEESSFNQAAVSKDGECIGAGQINPKFHAERMARLGVTDLYDLRGNMLVSIDYLAELTERYEDIGAALMAYNGTSAARIEKYFETGKLTPYAERILARSAAYERMHGK